ncbi:hypothetical protein GLA29479_4475 [Lysobacter antibioticus]|nr:hypothetical protein GLA29479_4475 [Lysobacter antibioticus]
MCDKRTAAIAQGRHVQTIGFVSIRAAGRSGARPGIGGFGVATSPKRQRSGIEAAGTFPIGPMQPIMAPCPPRSAPVRVPPTSRR